MNIDSNTTIGAALRAATTKPSDPAWLALSDAERAAYIAAAGHLRAFTGPGPMKRFDAERLGAALTKHNAQLFPEAAALAAGAAFINVAPTLCDELY